MLIALLSLAIAGLGALWFALKTSVRGYEDDFGFHEGVEHPIESVRTTVDPTPVSVKATSPKRKGSRAPMPEPIEQTTLSFY
jgi:hypothetical protein